MTMNLLFVDSRVTQYQQIVDSVNANTQCVVFDFHSDSLASLLAKCDKPSYNSIGLLQHNYHLPHFQMLSSMSPALLGNNNDFSSWNKFRDFITSLKNQKNIQNFDMMACALYNDPSWKAVLDYVENVTGVNIRASLDDTGSATFGGNWFLESDDVNLKTFYFTDAIDKYDGLLGSSADNSGFITTNNELYVWGDNSSTQIGPTFDALFNNNTYFSGNIAQVSFGDSHILILKNDGSVVACGLNSNGQLGDGSTTNRTTPVQVLAVNGVAGVGPYLTNIVAISAGGSHSMFLASDGSVVACGSNSFGRLGIGSTTNRSTPVQVLSVNGVAGVGPYISNIANITAGGSHSMFLASNGAVYACGLNSSGQLGDGSTTTRTSPVQVLAVNGVAGVGPYISNIAKISAGISHSMFLASDGSVVACGSNGSGRLGDGTTTQRTRPVQVLAVNGVAGVGPYLTNIANISAGSYYSMFLASDGSVVACGDNYYGQLGDGSTTARSTPVQVLAVNGVAGVGPYLSNIANISAGGYHSMFLASNGSVVACGSNSNGQLGDGSRTNRTIPVLSYSLSTITNTSFVHCSLSNNSGFLVNNTLYSCGTNSYNQLIRTSSPPFPITISTPTLFPNMSNVKMVSFSGSHMLILKNDGSVVACGSNGSGQLGDGSTTTRTSPVQVLAVNGVAGVGPYLSNIVAISAGGSHSMFLASDGSVVACGYNYYGRLGDGSTTNRSTPVQVLSVNGVAGVGPYLSNIVSISAGSYHSMFLASDGYVVACGRNSYGQLGDGSTTARSTPVQVLAVNGVAGVGPYISNIANISAGDSHSMFLASDGSVVACGYNYYGQLGDGSTTARSTPVQVLAVNGVAGVGPYISNIANISAGDSHSMFLASDGSVVACGWNSYGQLGDGSTTARSTPVQVLAVNGVAGVGPYLSNIANISAGYAHSIFLASDGSVVACGWNSSGRLGDGSTTDRSTVVNVNTSVTNIRVLNDIPPPPPTFGTFTIASKTFGDAAFAITAPSSNSNGLFSYSSSNTSVATVSGSNITIVGAGSAMITATQAATSNYDTGSVTATFVVAKANPIIQAWSLASKTYGDAAFAITAPSSNSPGSFSYSSSNTSVATVSGSNINIVGAGSTTITATQASTSNYESGSVTATFVVAKANPTINLVLQNTSNVILTNYNAVSYIKNKIPKDDILNLVVNSNSPGLISYGSNNTTIASISSVGLIRRRDYGNVRFTVSQPETSNYNSKTVHLNITIVPQASYGNRPNFLLGL